MPYRSKHNCSYSGCMIAVHGRFCDEHEKKDKQTRLRARVRSYNAEEKQFYNSTHWQALREQQLTAYPFCQADLPHDGKQCNAIAVHVDHIVARLDGGTDEPDNFQSLCQSCHSRKTVRYDGGFGNAKRR
ncbi:MAG: HNH endonuclease [Cyanobacteria bacterium SZAS-4]|nr:HNH endonuclease [Cyanobacteria bacterium SZAS-4]